jgi:chromosomal replication initiation ATPase DnaA
MNTKEQAELLIDKVCEYYKIRRSALTRKGSTRPPRLVVYYEGDNKVKVNLASLRMALSYYLNTYTNIPLSIVGPMCGYQDHSTIIYNKKRAEAYIKCEDYLFFPYWQTVNNLAKELNINTQYVRVMNKNTITMLPIHV